jgi:hypothetical protein
MWKTSPAGFLGLGSSDVRPYPGVTVCPTPASAQGTGLPVAGFAADVRGMTGVVAGSVALRLRPATGVFTQARAHDGITQNFIAQNDGTTLGNHPPKRPLS